MRDDELLSTYVGVVATAWEGSFGRDAVRLHRGRDNDVVIVGTQAAFRFPRHERAKAALPREAAAIGRLGEPGVVLPRVFLDCSAAPLGRAFVGERYLPGEPLPRSSVDAVGPMAYRFAAEIGRVLDALARVEPDADLRAILAEAPLHATFPALADAIRDAVFDRLSPAGRRRAGAELDAAVAATSRTPTRTLVHGHVVAENLLWDADDTRLTGVVGWSQVHLGDQAYDVGSLAHSYGWDLAATVAETLEHRDDALLDRARAYAATFALQTAYGALVAGDEDGATEALRDY